MYSYQTKIGATISAEFPERVVEIASKLGEQIHFSKNKQQFIRLEDMANDHIFNAIKIELDEKIKTPHGFVEFVLESPLVAELTARYT